MSSLKPILMCAHPLTSLYGLGTPFAMLNKSDAFPPAPTFPPRKSTYSHTLQYTKGAHVEARHVAASIYSPEYHGYASAGRSPATRPGHIPVYAMYLTYGAPTPACDAAVALLRR
ncbi:hypothetical protein GGR56DRAFT_20522 [Xylariaceae sp. FL0804]|nr:hypothetical protein GGR56DRAFT_20522 [Xylariaceae sp. FL0804]